MQGGEAEEGGHSWGIERLRGHQNLNGAGFNRAPVFLSHFYCPNIIVSLVFHASPSHSSLLLHSRFTYALPLFASPNCCGTSFPSGGSVRGIIIPPGFSGRIQILNILFQCSHKHTNPPQIMHSDFGGQALGRLSQG